METHPMLIDKELLPDSMSSNMQEIESFYKIDVKSIFAIPDGKAAGRQR